MATHEIRAALHAFDSASAAAGQLGLPLRAIRSHLAVARRAEQPDAEDQPSATNL